MYDVYEIRKLFPMLSRGHLMQGKPLVYLDNASTTFKPQCVIDACDKYYYEMNANSHRGDYDLLYNMDQEVAKTRKVVAEFIDAEPNEVVFTAGDTMALNMIAYGYGVKYLKPGDEIIVSYAEHASCILPWFKAAKETGAVIKYVDIDEHGIITVENFKKVVTDKTKIVSLAHVGNVLGTINEIEEIIKVAHKHGALVVVDGAQSVPHLKTSFKKLDADFLTFSAHKMCGPTGIGCLVGKYHLLEKMDTTFLGGGMNAIFKKDGTIEYLLPPAKFEAGTLNLSGIMGFKAAIEFIETLGINNIHQHDVEMVSYAIEKLKDYKDIIIYNKDAKNGILSFNIKGIFAQDEATLLNSKGIAIRSGEHCAKILDNYLQTKATCRMSTYLYTTKEDIDAFVDAIINGGDILDAYFS